MSDPDWIGWPTAKALKKTRQANAPATLNMVNILELPGDDSTSQKGN
jgi:hypothetical protein